MAKYLKLAFCSLLSAAGAFISLQASAAQCTAGQYLGGTYGLLVAGNTLSANANGGKYLTGALHFNSTSCTISGGNITGGPNAASTTQSMTGTYALNSDGTIAISLTPADNSGAQTYVVGVSPSNWEAVGIETDGTAAATIDLTPQIWLKKPSITYTNSALSGRFAVVCNGLASNKDDLNFVVFDGNGNLSGQNPYNYEGVLGNSPYTGSYTVAPDGTLSGVLFGSYSQYTFNGVIDAKGIEVKYIYNRAGFGEIVACHGRK